MFVDMLIRWRLILPAESNYTVQRDPLRAKLLLPAAYQKNMFMCQTVGIRKLVTLSKRHIYNDVKLFLHKF